VCSSRYISPLFAFFARARVFVPEVTERESDFEFFSLSSLFGSKALTQNFLHKKKKNFGYFCI